MELLDKLVALSPYFVVLVLVIVALGRLAGGTVKDFPYQRGKPLLSKVEAAFHTSLLTVANHPDLDLGVAMKVRISDILEVRPNVTGKRRLVAHNRISAKHVDFVLIDKKTAEVKLAIEVDDSSHQKRDRRKRDELVNKAFEVAGVPLLRYPVKGQAFNPFHLANAVFQACGLDTQATGTPAGPYYAAERAAHAAAAR